MYSKAIKIENMALVRKCPKTFMIMTKANQAPVELSTAASALLERTRLFLELPGLSLNEHPTVCGLRHTLHQPKSSASRLHAMPLAEKSCRSS